MTIALEESLPAGTSESILKPNLGATPALVKEEVNRNLHGHVHNLSKTASIMRLSETASKKGSKKADSGKVGKGKAEKKKKKPAWGTRTMSWDYTATQQFHDNPDDPLKGPMDFVPGLAESLDPPSLNLIYRTMMSQHKQTKSDSRKARVASKQLQVSGRRIAKTCLEIGECIAVLETRTSVLETDMGAVVQQSAIHESQIMDILWKMEDFENRQ
ncbi:hypothetical protein NDU88_003720 [Pleurodeles waltl]|uniref:Uncharacterized protein n=1 Tax=Pleurodeles waltl TaxID=8319 RepID=A0AAV7MT11_PLEWA|nr:hypothetical protein NDU88_003720 [Pleurodeles waltl]